MAFINEYISDEDWKKYNIQEIEDEFKMGNTSSDSWTVDKKNNTFLKKVAKSRVDDYGRTWIHWVFLWKEDLYFITTETIDVKEDGGHLWVHKKIKEFNFYDDQDIDNTLRETIMPNLTEAFMVHGDAGVYSTGGADGFDLKLEMNLT